jgi:DHA1 family tetracycline resistance protein-like MFS transporter
LLAEVTHAGNVATYIGIMTALYAAMQFIFAPVLGSLSDRLGRRPVLLVSLAGAAINYVILALFVLPESRPGDRSTPFAFAQLNPLKPLAWAFGLRQLLPMIAAYFLLVFVSQVYGTVWALYGQDAFQWNGLMVGLSLGAYGLCHALVQALLPGPMSKWLGESNTILLGLLGESVALIAAAIASQGWVIFAVMPLFALGGVGNPALQSLMTQQADADSQGRLQGVLASVVSIATIFGPLFFAAIYFAISTSWPGLIWVVCVALYVLAIPLFVRLRRGPTAPQPA